MPRDLRLPPARPLWHPPRVRAPHPGRPGSPAAGRAAAAMDRFALAPDGRRLALSVWADNGRPLHEARPAPSPADRRTAAAPAPAWLELL